jgi:predicted transposase/invertase (TIGR01784 family)
MYRTKQQREWDNQNVIDYEIKEARESAREEERLKAIAEKKEIAKILKNKGIDLEIIAEGIGFSLDEIIAL